MKLVIVFFLSLFLFQQIQADKIDSLSSVVKILPNDSNKVNTLVEISKSYFYTDPDKTISYANTAEKLAAEINFPKGLALSYKWIGMGYYIQGKYIEALDNWEKSLAQFEKNKDLVGQANILNNFGTIYFDQTDETKALEYFLKIVQMYPKNNISAKMVPIIEPGIKIVQEYPYLKEQYEQAYAPGGMGATKAKNEFDGILNHKNK